MAGAVRIFGERALRWCLVFAGVIGGLLVLADLVFAGRSLSLIALAAFIAPGVVLLLWANRWTRPLVALLLVVGAGLAALYFTPLSLAQQMISVPYRAEAVIRDGRLTLREEIQLDQTRFDEINAANGREGVRRLELTGATLSSGWSSAGSRDGNPVYQQVRVFEVANPRTMATVQIPVGLNWTDGLGEIRFRTGPRDIWTMHPSRDSTMEIRTTRRAIHATFPAATSITDSLAGEDVAVVPVAGNGYVTVALFGPLLNNAIGRAVYPIYRDNLLVWLVGIVFLALGAVLNAKLQLAIERGWAWVARRAGRGPSSTDESAERGAGRVELEVPVARRRRKRPVERHLDP
ncbi:hypothetical protein [Micromonospora sp. NPDC051006]|uniref:hypothetical protein n=1 Tax=Micromonospora sp. NPDC051006 TaxID=3364283 RepID=UPI003798D232